MYPRSKCKCHIVVHFWCKMCVTAKPANRANLLGILDLVVHLTNLTSHHIHRSIISLGILLVWLGTANHSLDACLGLIILRWMWCDVRFATYWLSSTDNWHQTGDPVWRHRQATSTQHVLDHWREWHYTARRFYSQWHVDFKRGQSKTLICKVSSMPSTFSHQSPQCCILHFSARKHYLYTEFCRCIKS